MFCVLKTFTRSICESINPSVILVLQLLKICLLNGRLEHGGLAKWIEAAHSRSCGKSEQGGKPHADLLGQIQAVAAIPEVDLKHENDLHWIWSTPQVAKWSWYHQTYESQIYFVLAQWKQTKQTGKKKIKRLTAESIWKPDKHVPRTFLAQALLHVAAGKLGFWGGAWTWDLTKRCLHLFTFNFS